MDPILLLIAAAVLAFVMIGGLGFVFVGGGSQQKAIKRARSVVQVGGARLDRSARRNPANDANSRRKQILKTLKEQERQSRRATLNIAARLRQTGLPITVAQFWIASAVMALIGMVGVLMIRPNMIAAVGMAFVAGVGLPRWIIGFMVRRRLKKFTVDFSDAIDVIVRGIRSGLPVHDCLKIIGRESPEPLGGEFRRLVENIGVGITTDQALEKMYERMPTPELKFFSIVLAIQQKTGGNLAEALANLSIVLRARKMMREKIKAMSSEAVASAFIIGCLPPGVVTLITVTSPQYMMLMFTDPRGHLMILGGLIWMALGILVMRKMINFRI
jgi:tight adherence protein B